MTQEAISNLISNLSQEDRDSFVNELAKYYQVFYVWTNEDYLTVIKKAISYMADDSNYPEELITLELLREYGIVDIDQDDLLRLHFDCDYNCANDFLNSNGDFDRLLDDLPNLEQIIRDKKIDIFL